MTKTQIDRLGTSLKAGQATPEELRLLDEFRRSFSPAYEKVISAIEVELNLKPTGRPAKSTTSITEKLIRESIRLTQIQDVAGCRVVVDDVAEQDRVVSELVRMFPSARVIDRRGAPSNGYRAVHTIVDFQGKLVEVQVRTSLQHLWAEVSEKLADVIDPAIKYGKGDQDVQRILSKMSEIVAGLELVEPYTEGKPPDGASGGLLNRSEELLKVRDEVRSLLESMIRDFEAEEGTDALSD